MTKATIGFAMCGSFCTFSKALLQMQRLVDIGYKVLPVMSQNAYSTDTRFGKATEMVKKAEEITGEKVLHTTVETEPIGPKKMCDLLLVAPCRHFGDNGSEITFKNIATCFIVRCNKRRLGRVSAKYRQIAEHKKYIFCTYGAGRLHKKA